MIRIVNLRNYKLNEGEVLVKVDRSSKLGNPFHMYGESQRDLVCRKYDNYFYSIMSNNAIAQTNMSAEEIKEFVDCVIHIILLARTRDVALGCWCAPKRCHAETIKKFVEKKLERV